MVGGRLRQLREERHLTQVDLAKALGISPSYLNQLEHNARPLTVPVLLRISDVFGIEASFFSAQDTTRLIAEVHETLIGNDLGLTANDREVSELVGSQPKIAQALVKLHRLHQQALEQLGQLSAEESAPLLPYEQVRDYFYSHTYIGSLDTAAERLANELSARRGELLSALANRLKQQHRLRLVEGDQESLGALHRFDPESGVLTVAANLRPNQQAFRLARQLALLEFERMLTELADNAGMMGADTHALMTIGLANYFAAALILPYEAFRTKAEEYRYDIERLARYFEVGFETVCHRLSTLQRPKDRGVPFSFVRVDRAGNVSKRISATPFHFSRTGGTCPLWNVYEAFTQPGKVLTQVAEMPDGRRYLWVSRVVTRSAGRYGAPSKTFAVGLGCEVRHAGRLVYSAGLDLDDKQAVTPIGMGCKMCERPDCAQRAFPPLGHTLSIDRNRTDFAPYPVAPRTN